MTIQRPVAVTGPTVNLESVMPQARESSLAFYAAFTQECNMLCLTNGDAAVAASDYDRAIDLYSAVINLNFASDIIFANRSKAKSEKMLWEDILLDAQKVR
jgi:hypothetical protein